MHVQHAQIQHKQQDEKKEKKEKRRIKLVSKHGLEDQLRQQNIKSIENTIAQNYTEILL